MRTIHPLSSHPRSGERSYMPDRSQFTRRAGTRQAHASRYGDPSIFSSLSSTRSPQGHRVLANAATRLTSDLSRLTRRAGTRQAHASRYVDPSIFSSLSPPLSPQGHHVLANAATRLTSHVSLAAQAHGRLTPAATGTLYLLFSILSPPSPPSPLAWHFGFRFPCAASSIARLAHSLQGL